VLQGLSLLKSDTEENATLRESDMVTKSTPFSALIQQAHTGNHPSNGGSQLQPIRMLSARKLLEGPVYTLAPITKLAPAFIQSCLLSRKA
jgi:hypothetical protein